MKINKISLEQRWKRVEEWIIGVWRFRQKGKAIKWAATYCFDGCYYDIWPVKTQNKALDIVFATIMKMNNKKRRRK